MTRRGTSAPTRQDPQTSDVHRLHALGTVVSAAAGAVLAVELIVPRPGQDVWDSMAAELPTFATFATSFVLVVSFWSRFGSALARVARPDRVTTVLATLLLLGIVALTLPTALLGRALAVDAFARSAAVVYACVVTATAAAGAGLAAHVDRRHRQLPAPVASAAAAPAAGLAAVAGAVVDARLGLVVCAALGVALLLVPSPVDEV